MDGKSLVYGREISGFSPSSPKYRAKAMLTEGNHF